MNEILQKRIEEAAEKSVLEIPPYITSDSANDSEVECAYKRAQETFIAGATFALQNQWISVDEALPEEDEQVIAMSEFGDIERMKYHNKAFYHLKGSIIKDGEKITHWMSIQQLKGGEE